jgi:hypothetical protein
MEKLTSTLKGLFSGKDDLPLHGASRSNNGVKGIPVVDRWVAMTVFWAIFFVSLFFFGIYHCRANSYSYSLICESMDCKYSVDETVTNLHSIISFPKSDFLDAELVRIDSQGNYVENSKVRAQSKEYFGYSIRMKIRLPPEPNSRMKIEKNLIFMPYDMTRRLARTGSKKMLDFIEKQDEKHVYFAKSAWVTTIGMLCIVFSMLGLVITCLFGQWTEYNPRRLKKAS